MSYSCTITCLKVLTKILQYKMQNAKLHQSYFGLFFQDEGKNVGYGFLEKQ